MSEYKVEIFDDEIKDNSIFNANLIIGKNFVASLPVCDEAHNTIINEIIEGYRQYGKNSNTNICG